MLYNNQSISCWAKSQTATTVVDVSDVLQDIVHKVFTLIINTLFLNFYCYNATIRHFFMGEWCFWLLTLSETDEGYSIKGVMCLN